MAAELMTIMIRAGKEFMKRIVKNKNEDMKAVAAKGVLTIAKKLKSTCFLAIKMVTMEEVAIIPVA